MPSPHSFTGVLDTWSFLLAWSLGSHISAVHGFLLPTSLLPNFTSTDDCLTPIIAQTHAQSVYFICEPNSPFCPVDYMIYSPGITWVYYDENMNLGSKQYDICIIATDNVPRMVQLLHICQECRRANTVLTFPPHKTLDYQEQQNIFYEAWKLAIIDIVILLTNPLYCRAFSYIPFKAHGKCYDTNPILFSSWKMNNTPNSTLFPENKVSNLHSCKLVFKYDLANRDMISRHGLFLSALSVAMNVTIVIRHLEDEEYLRGTNGSVDGWLARLPLLSHFYQRGIFSFYIDYKEIGIAIPVQPRSSVQWFRLFNQLSVKVWCGVVISFTLSVFVCHVFLKSEKLSVSDIVLIVFRPFVGESYPFHVVPWYTRVYLLFWVLFCFVLDSTYLSGLLSMLTVPFTDDAIKTFRDFIESDILLNCTPNWNGTIQADFPSNEHYDALKRKIIFVNNTPNVLPWDSIRDDAAYLTTKENFDLTFPRGTHRLLPGETVMIVRTSPLVLLRPSPYGHVFQTAVLRVAGSGVFERNDKNVRFNKLRRVFRIINKGKTGPEALSVKALVPVFVCWSVGCALGLGVFFIELCLSGQLCHIFHVKKLSPQ